MNCTICKRPLATIPNNGGQDPCKDCVTLVLKQLPTDKKSTSVEAIGAALKRIQPGYPASAIVKFVVLELQKPPPKLKANKAPPPAAAAAPTAAAAAGMAAAGAGANAPPQHVLSNPIDSARTQLEIDRFYASTLRLKYLDIAVHTRDAGGLGDLINCLQTSTILVDEEESWRATPHCGHKDFDVMSACFTKLKPSFNVSALKVDIATAMQNDSEHDGTIIEYSMAKPAILNPKLRYSGLAAHEMGIMINERLRTPLPLSDLALTQPDLKKLLEECSKSHKPPRLFFGYGAGKHNNTHFNLLLDRVFHDDSITSAVILPVNHLQDHLEKYLRTNDHNTLIPDLGKNHDITKLKTCQHATFRLGQRVIHVINMNQGRTVPYDDMLQLWRAADRSFTITEGDQSFSEAISAGIPMAYQLWHPGNGIVHKQPLFDALLSACATKYPAVNAFLQNCRDYSGAAAKSSAAAAGAAAAGAAPAVASPVQRKMELLKKIIQDCNNPKFINDYVKFTEELAEQHSISRHLQGFVQRLWLRKAHNDNLLTELDSKLRTLFALEDANDSDAMRPLLHRLREDIRAANIKLFNQHGGVVANQGAASAEDSPIRAKRIEAIGQVAKGPGEGPQPMLTPILGLIADYLP